MTDERTPLTIVTGFLGSGKTTLIQRYLKTERSGTVGIVINEFGEVGVDGAILLHATENLSVVAGGCACCAKRADIARSIHDLLERGRSAAAITHLLLETSGLADPAPIITTILADPWLAARIRLVQVLVVVDGVAGLANLATRHEARKQVALADTIVISKADIANDRALAALSSRLRAIAPDPAIISTLEAGFDLPAALWTPSLRPPDDITAALASSRETSSHDTGRDYRSLVWRFAEPVDWTFLTIWLSALLHAHGERIVRVKGLIRTSISQSCIALHGVQHMLHAPVHIEGDDGADSYLIFITRDFDDSRVQPSFEAFARAFGGRASADLRAEDQSGEAAGSHSAEPNPPPPGVSMWKRSPASASI